MVRPLALGPRFIREIKLNGFSDELGYERRYLDRSLPFEELREIRHIKPYLERPPEPEDFSRRIRPYLSGDRSGKEWSKRRHPVPSTPFA